MTALSRCNPHYIRWCDRCLFVVVVSQLLFASIKPNDEKKAKTFDDKRVQHQVQYLGLLENVK